MSELRETMMNEYQKEQFESLTMVREMVPSFSGQKLKDIKMLLEDYLAFRESVDEFNVRFFAGACAAHCFENKKSACCSKEGIITFWADMFINAMVSTDLEILSLLYTLQQPNIGSYCIYLGQGGCMWKIKPIICQMFLCSHVKKLVFDQYPEAEVVWTDLKKQEKQFTWPDHPVLFDVLEQIGIDCGYQSPLMYLHFSPGMRKVREQAAIKHHRSI